MSYSSANRVSYESDSNYSRPFAFNCVHSRSFAFNSVYAGSCGDLSTFKRKPLLCDDDDDDDFETTYLCLAVYSSTKETVQYLLEDIKVDIIGVKVGERRHF